MGTVHQDAKGNVTKVGLWHGTVIKLQDGRRFKVTKLNPVNIKMMDESGKNGWQLNRQFAETCIDPDQSWDGPKEKNPYELAQEAAAAGITLGSTVQLTEQRMNNKYGNHVWVVIAMPSNGKLRLAKLGGDNGRYLTGIPQDRVEVVAV